MQPLYESDRGDFEIFIKKNHMYPPHLHGFLEIVYMLEGYQTVSQGAERFPMEKGDLAIIFPEIIHGYQIYSDDISRGIYFLVSPEAHAPYTNPLKLYMPKQPVIPAACLHPDVEHAMRTLLAASGDARQRMLFAGYLQVILARILPDLELTERPAPGREGLVYQVVSYISNHFREEVTLKKMTEDLGVSSYILSRIFSTVLRMNFNTYLNAARLHYACNLLERTDRPILDVAMESGFSSLRTFNRFFLEQLRMSPRDFRKKAQAEGQGVVVL